MTNKEAIEIIKSECYIFNPLNFDRSTMVNTALNMAIKALEKEPCEDCVSREAVKEALRNRTGESISDCINALPSVTPTRKKAKWIVLKDEYGDICEAICSCCEDNGNHRWKYCHTCGAEMEREE